MMHAEFKRHVQAQEVKRCKTCWLPSFLWWASGRHRVRRIKRRGELSAADINRLVVALNRSQMLNTRAAFTTACACALAGLQLVLDLT
ncbi:hypothetical protein RHIZ404_230450 [Rhizobium sp. EC-SD404]|nr:hypothetical protein RHIZ404_230450 [Rhizobium sp. EC-SD404]